MTRMLCNYLTILAFCFGLIGCSLFQSGDDTVSAAEIDSQSLSDDNQLTGEDDLGLEEEMRLENEDLGSDEFSEASFDDAGDLTDDALDDEFADADADFDDEAAFGDNEFSASSDEFIDQNLVGDELDPAADQSVLEEFAAGPVIDEPDPQQPVVDVPAQPAEPQASSSSWVNDGVNRVTNLQYKAFENGGTVVIETSQPATYEKSVDGATNQVIIKVAGAKLPETFKRPYITKDFKQDVATINAFNDETGDAQFVIQMKRPVDPVVQQEGNVILVMTSQSTSLADTNPTPPQPSMMVPGQTRPSTGVQNNSFASGQSVFKESAQSAVNLDPTQFTGEKISLEFVDTDVRQIIETVAQKTGVNLIMDNEVKGRTSVRLRDVPWDQALLVILRSQGLGYVKQGNVLRIAKQQTLSKEANQVSEQIASEKKAKQLAGGIKVKYIPVSYAKVAELAKKLESFTSKEGKVAFDDRTSSLVITDYGEYVARISELVKALDTPPLQVEIEAKLVEAQETFLRESGINWQINGQSFGVGGRSATINSRLANTLGSQGFSLDLDVGTFNIFGDLTTTLRLFEDQNKVKVLSQPKILTVNKQKAEIEQVTQIPIVTTVVNGNASQEQVLFQDLKLGLAVTPQITFKGDVILDVELNREFPGQTADNGQRELNRRKAKTTVMVNSGKTAVIGGIYQLDDTVAERGIPVLKDIPLIGALFRQDKVEKLKNELLLFLKPNILNQQKSLVSSPSVSPPSQQGFDPFEELAVDEGVAEVDFEEFGVEEGSASDQPEIQLQAPVSPESANEEDSFELDSEESFSL